MTATSEKTIGDYVLTNLVRTVADAEYYEAHRIGDQEQVIVKTSPLRPGSEEFKRMALELRVLAPLASPYIAPLLDAGHDDGLLYAVFPSYSDGATSPDLAPEVNLGLAADAARGAHELHEAGIVHRNIQPSSILQTSKNGVLTDLGMLRSLSPSNATTTIGPIGSLQFSDPDLLSGAHRGSRRSDIWSIGSTVHYLLSGKHLVGELPNGGVQQVLRARLQVELVIDSQLPAEAINFIQTCIGTESRYSTCKEVSEGLDDLKGIYV